MFLDATVLVRKFRKYGYTVTAARKIFFLEAVASGACIAEAARSAGIHRGTHYEWLSPESDPEGVYAAAFESAREQFQRGVRQAPRAKQTAPHVGQRFLSFCFSQDGEKRVRTRTAGADGAGHSIQRKVKLG